MKYSRIFIIILGLLFLNCIRLAADNGEEDMAEIFYQEGVRKYILKDYLGAIEDFKNAYRLNSHDLKIKNMYINALIKQGNIEYEQKNYESAEMYYARALELSPDNKELVNLLTQVQAAIKEEKRLQELAEATTTSEATTETASETTSETATETVTEHKTETTTEAETESVTESTPEVTTTTEAVTEQETTTEQAEPTQRYPETATVVQVQLPYDMHEYIQQQNQENIRILNELIASQEKEREMLLDNIEMIAQSQSQDRIFFSNFLIIILSIVGGILFLIIIFITIIIFSRRRRLAFSEGYDMQSTLDYTPQKLIESTQAIDDTKYITDEHYPNLVKAKRLGKLYNELKSGAFSWETIQNYISELNYELKTEILNIVEKKIESGESSNIQSALEILLPLITDSETEISKKSKQIINKMTYSAQQQEMENLELQEASDPLNLNNLYHLAKMVDTKTDRIGHSVNVAEIAALIAEAIKEPDLDPLVVKKIGLAHDVGYLEIADTILKQEGALSQRQFSLIKSHPQRGLKLFEHTDLSKIFREGILYHHERLDGSGYPDGLKGDEVPPIARIIAIADIFDAATSPRPYKKSLSVELCFQMMEKIAGDLIDKNIFEIFMNTYNKLKGKKDDKQ